MAHSSSFSSGFIIKWIILKILVLTFKPNVTTYPDNFVHIEIYCINLTINNNLIYFAYSWHNVLKSKFMGGKRNRRVDYLVHLLVTKVNPYYIKSMVQKAAGMKGLSVEMELFEAIKKKSEQIPEDDIKVLSQFENC